MQTTTTTGFDVTHVGLYRSLARLMNAEPERYRVLGDADMVAVFSIVGDAGVTNIQLVFAELGCESVESVADEESTRADFRLVGPVTAWTAMFEDILANGAASGEWTINSLALRGDRIQCVGDDPMGLDKFSRFIQTLQEFLDGAARLADGRSDA